ncbi:MAG: hypothetical protein IK118_05430 [Clostridia bacterium]|nr:hypothetical protein [Clostridia bacterium]
MRRCPKCRERVSPFYFKIACPECGADLMYYNFDERLEQDARKAAAQEEKVQRLLKKLPLPGKKYREREE